MDSIKTSRQIKLLLLISLTILTGCQQEKDDLEAYVARVQSQQQADIPPIPVMKPYEKFNYAAGDLRNPFIPTVIDVPEEVVDNTADNGIQPDQNRRKEALEFFELRDLQFVGTLEQDKVWALIRSPDNVIHKVSVGDHMGRNHGEIQSISDRELELKEIVPEGNGYIEQATTLSVVEIN